MTTTAPKRDRYHHGDLRAALIDVAVELIGERGIRGFSLAEASRRLGVSVSAPYRHFADRDELLAATAVRATAVLARTLAAEVEPAAEPADQLAAAAGGCVRFAAANAALFETLVATGLDRRRHPELEHAARSVADAFGRPAAALCGGDPDAARALVLAVTATAHGHATMLIEGAFGAGAGAVEAAAARAAGAARALSAGRAALGS